MLVKRVAGIAAVGGLGQFARVQNGRFLGWGEAMVLLGLQRGEFLRADGRARQGKRHARRCSRGTQLSVLKPSGRLSFMLDAVHGTASHDGRKQWNETLQHIGLMGHGAEKLSARPDLDSSPARKASCAGSTGLIAEAIATV